MNPVYRAHRMDVASIAANGSHHVLYSDICSLTPWLAMALFRGQTPGSKPQPIPASTNRSVFWPMLMPCRACADATVY